MSNLSSIPFRKMNGLGNDFVILDARNTALPVDHESARAISDRNSGVGCDQLIVLEMSPVADVRMRIWNNSGDEVESCGNASRCVADLIFRETGKDEVTIDTDGGLLRCSRADQGLVTVEQQIARTESEPGRSAALRIASATATMISRFAVEISG